MQRDCLPTHALGPSQPVCLFLWNANVLERLCNTLNVEVSPMENSIQGLSGGYSTREPNLGQVPYLGPLLKAL